ELAEERPGGVRVARADLGMHDGMAHGGFLSPSATRAGGPGTEMTREDPRDRRGVGDGWRQQVAWMSLMHVGTDEPNVDSAAAAAARVAAVGLAAAASAVVFSAE